MSNYFLPGRASDHWFRVGRLEVTSTVAVVLLGALGLLFSVISISIPQTLAYLPDLLWGGQVWRLLTWPLADVISFQSALSLFMLWYFGSYIEAQIGRTKMAWLYLGMWASLTCAASVVRIVGPTVLVGMSLIQLAILLLWIAQYPNARFFFNIPAWAFGAFIVGVQALALVARRDFSSLLTIMLGLVLIASLARSVGLLSAYPWIPGAPQPRKTAAPSKKRKVHPSAEARIDELLDKINAEGIHSLTKKERAELDRLRKQRRG